MAHASKALNETQVNYAQIEKETLAIVYVCENFINKPSVKSL